MKRKLKGWLGSLTLALLLFSIGAAMLAAYASGAEGNPGQEPLLADAASAGDSPACLGLFQPEPAAGDGDCYTVDTSRPEWLPRYIYLPAVMKNYSS
jgi:hypothetical protein